MSNFVIPVVLFIFKRELVLEVIKSISMIKPKTLIIIADGPRNEEERLITNKCRNLVEKSIDWDCNVIKKYHEKNVGIYKNIGEGAKWVFSFNKYAIFLEDDTIPDLSFFTFCQEMLQRYENEPKILWVMGSNYLKRFESKDNYSYYFTKHMLPCGWASWSHKFLINYDGELKTFNTRSFLKLRKRYYNFAIFYQFFSAILSEKKRFIKFSKPISWDYQMDYSIKNNDLFGIIPKTNLIKNVGFDSHSTHGGNNLNNVMTNRFCNNETYTLPVTLIHPDKIKINKKLEKSLTYIIIPPFGLRLRHYILSFVRFFFNIPIEKSTYEYFFKKK